ncbi:histidine kinase [Algoriphagus boritolerans]|uniref:histidine kinase n=1 Tax=Algoriphagus boritolerans TaxID=308111 RepID=UPI002FCE36D8
MSPHFSLNLIGGLATKALKSSPEIAQDLENMADVLGYAYVDPTKFNPLSGEIKAICSYLHSQKVRFEDQLFLKKRISTDLLELNQLYMPKMILLSLVDNIFKHGDYKDPHHPVFIEARMVGAMTPDACFYFRTKNRIQSKLPVKPSGFGIPTITNLLDFYFPGFSLKIEKDSHWFSLNLMIPYGEENPNWPNR